MDSPMTTAIRERLASYLRGETTLQAFDAWFVPATWEIRHEDDPEAADMTNEIYLRIAEYSLGHRTEEELKGFFRPLVRLPVAAR